MSRTIGEITGELYNLIDEAGRSQEIWDTVLANAVNPNSPFSRGDLQKQSYEATRIHSEVVERIEGIIKELKDGAYVDRNSPPQELAETGARIEAQRKRLERRRNRT